MERIWDWILDKGIWIVVAALAVIVGFKLIDMLDRLIKKRMEKKQIGDTNAIFLGNALKIVLKVLLLATGLKTVGIDTTAFVAILGTASLALGLSIQGVLSNVASGFMLLFFRPFKNGDIIEAKGRTGKVMAIGVIHTTLLTEDYKTILVPNSFLTSDVVVNYTVHSAEKTDAENGGGMAVKGSLQDIKAKTEKLFHRRREE